MKTIKVELRLKIIIILFLNGVFKSTNSFTISANGQPIITSSCSSATTSISSSTSKHHYSTSASDDKQIKYQLASSATQLKPITALRPQRTIYKLNRRIKKSPKQSYDSWIAQFCSQPTSTTTGGKPTGSK